MGGQRIVGHGVDLVENARIAALLEAHGAAFVERVFTSAERAYAEQGTRRRVERFAARFAAKEAVLKAIGTGWRDGIAWRDIEVLRLPSGAPRVLLTNRCAAVAADLGITRWHLSLSHTDSHSMASALALADPADMPEREPAPRA